MDRDTLLWVAGSLGAALLVALILLVAQARRGRAAGALAATQTLPAVPAAPGGAADTASREGGHMVTGTFGPAINCVDGRAQSPVADWVKIHGHVTYVDTATIPGADKVLAEGPHDLIATLRRNIEVSVHRHESAIIAVAGHHDCAANPASAEDHKRMIREAVQVVHGWGLPVRVVGLWINEWWQIEQVADTAGGA